MKVTKGPQTQSGIVSMEVSDEILEFLKYFNMIHMHNVAEYYNVPYWFKTTDVKNKLLVLTTEDLIFDNGRLTRQLNEKDNIK